MRWSRDGRLAVLRIAADAGRDDRGRRPAGRARRRRRADRPHRPACRRPGRRCRRRPGRCRLRRRRRLLRPGHGGVGQCGACFGAGTCPRCRAGRARPPFGAFGRRSAQHGRERWDDNRRQQPDLARGRDAGHAAGPSAYDDLAATADGVYFRSAPHTAAVVRINGYGVFANERVRLTCHASGDAVGPGSDRLWYRVTNVSRPTVAGRANAGWLNAHYVNDGKGPNVVDAGVPAC